jgi:hypothetical protein
MEMNILKDFSVEKGGYVGADGEYDDVTTAMRGVEVHTIGGVPYIFDGGERMLKAIYEGAEEDAERVDPVSKRSRIYRCVPLSGDGQAVAGIEVTDRNKKSYLVAQVANSQVERNQRQAWEISQGWHRDDDVFACDLV